MESTSVSGPASARATASAPDKRWRFDKRMKMAQVFCCMSLLYGAVSLCCERRNHPHKYLEAFLVVRDAGEFVVGVVGILHSVPVPHVSKPSQNKAGKDGITP